MSEQVTIVTAFVDIGRGKWRGIKNGEIIPSYIKRHNDVYFDRFQRLSKLKNPIICFTESKFFDRIRSMRDDITLVAIDTLFHDHAHLVSAIENVQNNPLFVQLVDNKSSPERWSPQYVVINALKSYFVNHAVQNKLNKTNTCAWIDFGYARNAFHCPEGLDWKFDTEGKINLFSTVPHVPPEPIINIIKSGQVYIQGCHIVAPASEWSVLSELTHAAMVTMLNVGLIDDDQTMLLMAVRFAPEKFAVRFNGHGDWFTMFTKFNHG